MSDPGQNSAVTFGTVTLGNNYTSTIIDDVDVYDPANTGSLTVLSTGSLTRTAGSSGTVQFIDQGADLGSANNTLTFSVVPATVGTVGNATSQGNAIVPFATILMAGNTAANPTAGTTQGAAPIWNLVAGNDASITPFTNYTYANSTSLSSLTGTSAGAVYLIDPTLTVGSGGSGSQTNITSSPIINALVIRNASTAAPVSITAGTGTPSLTITSGVILGMGTDSNINMPLNLGANEAFITTPTLVINSGVACLTIAGNIAVTSTVAKVGNGTLELEGINNAYTSGTTIDQGILRINNVNGNLVTGNSARAGTGTLTITANTTLELAGGACLANAVTVSGFGFANEGAIRTAYGDYSTNYLNGTLTLSSATDIRVDGNLACAVQDGCLVINGVISNAGDLDKFGFGCLTLGGGANNTYTGNTNIFEGTVFLNKTGTGIGCATGTGCVNIGDSLNGSNATGVNAACLVIVAPGGCQINTNGVNGTTGLISVRADGELYLATNACIAFTETAAATALSLDIGPTASGNVSMASGASLFFGALGGNDTINVTSNLLGGLPGCSVITGGTVSAGGNATLFATVVDLPVGPAGVATGSQTDLNMTGTELVTGNTSSVGFLKSGAAGCCWATTTSPPAWATASSAACGSTSASCSSTTPVRWDAPPAPPLLASRPPAPPFA